MASDIPAAVDLYRASMASGPSIIVNETPRIFTIPIKLQLDIID
jgi:hypothetical protein